MIVGQVHGGGEVALCPAQFVPLVPFKAYGNPRELKEAPHSPRPVPLNAVAIMADGRLKSVPGSFVGWRGWVIDDVRSCAGFVVARYQDVDAGVAKGVEVSAALVDEALDIRVDVTGEGAGSVVGWTEVTVFVTVVVSVRVLVTVMVDVSTTGWSDRSTVPTAVRSITRISTVMMEAGNGLEKVDVMSES